MQFRKDINGLRAIAVIGVVIFHFNDNWLLGGFVGVDVFFVVSGFLMTKIIITGLEQQEFSLIRFYLSRARRIIPALAFMIFILLIFGWFYLSVVDYSILSKHSISSIGFFSNLYYLSESGYFDVDSHKKWLLHTWSLSVEWQFYLIYPVIILLLLKSGFKKKIKLSVILLSIVSFIYCVYLTNISPNSSFYILPTRAWEMMVGGIVYFYPISVSNKIKRMFEFSGLSLILIAYFTVSSSNVWPGYLTLLPVLGAGLIILANYNQSRITGNFFLQHIGKYSYSIYLWHWPIVLSFGYFGLSTTQHLISGIFLSLVAGYLSYILIERKSSFKIDTSNILKIITYRPILMSGALFSICIIIYLFKGIPIRLDNRIQIAANEFNNRPLLQCDKDTNKTEHCIIGNQDNITAVILGDSHSKSLTTALAETVDTKNNGVLLISSLACPYILGAKITSNKNCFDSNNATSILIKESYPDLPIFVINRTSVYIYGQSNPARIKSKNNSPLIYFNSEYITVTDKLLSEFSEHYKTTMCQLAENNTIFITTPTPEMLVNVPDFMSNRMLLRNDFSDYITPLNDHLLRNKFVNNLIQNTANECGVNILNTEKYLCASESCIGSINGRPIYFDGDHLSEFGNKLLTPMFKKALYR